MRDEEYYNTLTGERLEKGLYGHRSRGLMAKAATHKAAAFSYPRHALHAIVVCEYDCFFLEIQKNYCTFHNLFIIHLQ